MKLKLLLKIFKKKGILFYLNKRGTQKDGMPPQADDNEEQHVLIVGETEENVNRAKYLIEKVIYSDDGTRTKIKDEQLKASQEMRTVSFLSILI